MKISSKILSKYFFIYTAFIIAILFFFIVASENLTNDYMIVEKGSLNIVEELDYKEYSLIGHWEYYPDKLYTPEELSNNNIKKSYSYVEIEGSDLVGTSGTYVININNNIDRDIALQFPIFRGGYKIFLNGELVSYTENDWNDNNVPSIFKETIVPLHRNSNNKVVIHMSRDNYFIFGFTYAPTIATDNFFIREEADLKFQKAIVGVSIAIITLFLIVIYVGSYGKKNSQLPLFYLCAAVAVTYLQYVIPNFVKVVNYYEYTKIHSFFLVLSTYLVYAFVYKSFYTLKVSRGFFEGSTWIVSFHLIFIVFSNNDHSNLTYRLTLIVFLYLLCSALHFTTLALNRKNRDAIYIFCILGILTLTFTFNLKFIHFYQFKNLIFISYLLCFFVVIVKLVSENRIYALTYKNIEYDLIHKSKLKHKELVEYNDVLLAEIVARKEAEQSLVEITTKDYLTGLYNRLYGNSKLTTLVEKFKVDGSAFSIIMIDIDNFKYINDTYGHDCGDEVIKALAKVMLNTTRHSDIVTRWGGEEFLVILPNAKIESAIYVSEKIRRGIETCMVPVVGSVTASLGVAEVRVGEDYEATIVRSDENLYLAKKNGKNCTYPRL